MKHYRIIQKSDGLFYGQERRRKRGIWWTITPGEHNFIRLEDRMIAEVMEKHPKIAAAEASKPAPAEIPHWQVPRSTSRLVAVVATYRTELLFD